MTVPSSLRSVSAPFLTTSTEPSSLTTAMQSWQSEGFLVRAVRGPKCRTVERLFDEFAAACQFPWYFGENWAAFAECIADLDWLHLGAGIVVVVLDADAVLVLEEGSELRTFARVMGAAAQELGQAVDVGEAWDRPALPFHVVLHSSTTSGLDRWRSLDAVLGVLDDR